MRKQTTNTELLSYCNDLNKYGLVVEFLSRMGKYEIEVNGVTYRDGLSKRECGNILHAMRFMAMVMSEEG